MNPHPGVPGNGYREESVSSGHSISDSRPTVVGLHFRVGKKIGEGSFGIIHEGIIFFIFILEAICHIGTGRAKDLTHSIHAFLFVGCY